MKIQQILELYYNFEKQIFCYTADQKRVKCCAFVFFIPFQFVSNMYIYVKYNK